MPPLEAEFNGRRILLTGASGSIGRVTAVKLAEAGAHVVLNGRDAGKLETVAATMPAGSFTIAPFDLANGDGIVGWMRELAERAGPFAGLAHTAGSHAIKPLRSTDSAFVDAMLNANVTSAILLGKGFRHRQCHADGASMVLISSMSYRVGGAGQIAYAASKGGIIAATKAMAHELLRDNIRVNCVVPATIVSEMSSRARDAIPSESWDALVSGHPMGLGNADDIANAIIYLLSGRTRWMTGTDMQIDGGLSIV